MSRAYRISVKESVKRVVRAKDHISTSLEVLDVLPREHMADLLRRDLEGRGFKRQGKDMVRTKNGVTVTVEAETGKVTVQAELEKKVQVEGERESRVYTDVGPEGNNAKERLRKELKADLEKQVDDQADKLQKQATDKLEAQLGDLRKELDQAVNRVTAEALKQKAASLGTIKEVTEDPQNGSLTIVLEV